MKKFTLFLLAMGLSLSSVQLTQASFSDVPASHPNYDAINYVQAKGIVQGYPDGTYRADLKINRAEFTKIIVGATYKKEQIDAVEQCFIQYKETETTCQTDSVCKRIGQVMKGGCMLNSLNIQVDGADELIKKATDYDICFKDIAHDQWYSKYVCLAKMLGMIDGYPDGTFQAGNQINLVEAAKIIINGFKYSVPTGPIWYKPYILKLEELKALPVTLNGFEHQVTRGEMAEMIDRLMEKITTRPSTTYTNLEAGTKANNITNEPPSNIMNPAITYFNVIRSIQLQSTKDFNEFLDFFDINFNQGDMAPVEVERKQLINTLNSYKSKVEQLGDYKADEMLKKRTLEQLDVRIQSLNQEMATAIQNLIEVKENNLTQEELQKNLAQYDRAMTSFSMKNLNSEMIIERVNQTFDLKYNLYKSPQEYYGMLNSIFMNAYYYFNTYTDNARALDLSSDTETFDTLKLEHKDALDTINDIVEDLSDLNGYNGDRAFQEGTIASIKIMIDLLENEEAKMLDLWTNFLANKGKTQEAALEEATLLNTIHDKQENLHEVRYEAEVGFKSKYNL